MQTESGSIGDKINGLVTWLTAFVTRIRECVDAMPPFWIGFILIWGCFWGIAPNGNEENYLLWAKMLMDPDWIVNGQETSGPRIIFETLFGTLLKFLTFEQVVFSGRLFFAICFAWGISKIYQMLGLSSLWLLIHLPAAYFGYQSMFALSWIFLTVEAKSLAFGFLFAAFYFWLKPSPRMMLVCLVAATYCHILVGGYASGFMLIASVLASPGKDLSTVMKQLVIYTVLVLPFLIYVFLSVSISDNQPPLASWIYTYYRAPHHTALFKSLGMFYAMHYQGVLVGLFSLGVILLLLKDQSSIHIKKLLWFCLLSLTFSLVFVAVAAIDKTGALLKYYPFRINALTTFILLLVICNVLSEKLSKPHNALILNTLFLIGLFAFQFHATTNAYSQITSTIRPNVPMNQIAEVIKLQCPGDYQILYLNPGSMDGPLWLSRKMERKMFANYKFVPADLSKLKEWYARVELKNKIRKRESPISEAYARQAKLGILSHFEIKDPSLELVKSIGHYHFYLPVKTP